jgi:hypothetical protein
MNDVVLAAFSIERRAVCFTLFRQIRLEDVLLRQLPPDEIKAASLITGFLNQVLERDEIGYFAFATPPDRASNRHRQLYAAGLAEVRTKGIPYIEVPESDLLSTYGHPPLKRREQLRKVGRTIWPALNSKPASRAAVDAAVLGLHVQVERLFGLYEVRP